LLSWIKKAFTSQTSEHNNQISEKLIETSSIYIQLVKSRIVGAMVTDEALLMPHNVLNDTHPLLMSALCAYFAARTDYELEERKVSEDTRDQIWSEIINVVFEEMDITGEVASTMRYLTLNQMSLAAGVIETKGVTDYEAVSTLLTIMSKDRNAAESNDSETDSPIDRNRVNTLMQKYEGYSSLLDTIAAEFQRDT
jgi:hypothetical protein